MEELPLQTLEWPWPPSSWLVSTLKSCLIFFKYYSAFCMWRCINEKYKARDAAPLAINIQASGFGFDHRLDIHVSPRISTDSRTSLIECVAALEKSSASFTTPDPPSPVDDRSTHLAVTTVAFVAAKRKEHTRHIHTKQTGKGTEHRLRIQQNEDATENSPKGMGAS